MTRRAESGGSMGIFDRFRKKQPPAFNARVLALLDEIEAEMRDIGYWRAGTPAEPIRTARDAPTFEMWLQFVFLPNARRAAEKGRYPGGSQVGLMAARQYDYHDFVEEAQGLVSLLHQFDQLVRRR